MPRIHQLNRILIQVIGILTYHSNCKILKNIYGGNGFPTTTDCDIFPCDIEDYHFVRLATGVLLLVSVFIILCVCYMNLFQRCKVGKLQFIKKEYQKKYNIFAGTLSPLIGNNLDWTNSLEVIKNKNFNELQLRHNDHFENTKLDRRKYNSSWPSNIDLLNSKKYLRRCSSTQHIHFKKIEKSPSMSTYSSLPNVCQDNTNELKPDDCQTHSELIIRNPNVSCSNRSGIPSLQVNGEELFYDEALDGVDEGQMQCMMQYQKNRSLIVIKSLSVQTIIPQYIPAFYIEISVIPSHENQVWCSRMYPSKDGIVDITINEMFEIQANDEDIKYRSLIISVNPVIGNFKLYAETELAYLDTPNSQEIYLGGFLKGVYTLSC